MLGAGKVTHGTAVRAYRCARAIHQQPETVKIEAHTQLLIDGILRGHRTSLSRAITLGTKLPLVFRTRH
jgi:hypothetical protein